MERQCVVELLLDLGAVELRTTEPYFTFASGIRSPVYTDNRLLISQPEARRSVCQAFAEAIAQHGLRPDVIAGTATAGIPHAAFLAERLDLPLVYVRGGAKAHGKGNRIEGRLAPGARVVLIEDLISTGGSSIAAAEALRAAGAQVVGVLAIFSYGFASAEHGFREAGFPVQSLAGFSDLVALARRRGAVNDQTAAVLQRWSTDPEHWPAATPGVTAPRPSEVSDRLIVAADLPDRPAIEQLARDVVGAARYLKLNASFITHGPSLVTAVRNSGLEVFLDLKFHDIPNTASNYVEAAAALDVQLVTIHASGGPAMMRACVAAAARSDAAKRPRLLAVTALTSLSNDELRAVGYSDGRDAQVVRLARLAQESGVDGVVCSVSEARAVRDACGPGFLIVTPGVRPAGSAVDDHARSATPADALREGADMVVVGRPIYRAPSAGDAAAAVAAELRQAETSAS